MTKKNIITWILVADARRAQVYIRERVERLGLSSRGATHKLVAVAGMRWKAESVHEYEVGRNAIGMVFQSVGNARHMAEPHIDVREEVKLHFAKAIATNLNAAKEKKQFDCLVLVAPPKMLREIKDHLDKDVQKTVVAELPKELTHYNGDALYEHLHDIFKS